MADSPIETLPTELLLEIFEHLDSPPPTELNERLEPSLHLTSSPDQTYKKVSLVSQRWRKIVLPLLFRYSRIRLDVTPKPEWHACSICHFGTAPLGIATAVDSLEVLHAQQVANVLREHGNEGNTPPRDPIETESLSWAFRFHHVTNDYLRFVTHKGLQSSVQSLVIMTDKTMPGGDRFPHRFAATLDYRYRAAAVLWQEVYSVIDPSRIIVLAPPGDMACLSNCAIDMFGDWAFADMDLHILSLAINKDFESPAGLRPTAVDFKDLQYIPDEYPGIADSSILKLKPWTHLGLNEGSFLKAYGTYHYFEMGAPSLVYSIKDCFSSPKRARQRSSGEQIDMDLTALRSLKYTAILPFANHLQFHGLLPHLDELDVKLAPDPTQLGILSDKARVGRAELEDCWQEFFSAYRLLTRPFRTHEIQQDGTPKLKRFVCQDVKIPGLQTELDDEFMPLCLPCWAEMEPGIFVRQRAAPFVIDEEITG